MESQESWPVSAALSAFASLALVFGIWWWYFDIARGAAERHIRSAKDVAWFQIWSHVHFPLYLSIAVLGVGIEHIILLPTGTRVSLQHASILIGSASALMSTLIIIALTSSRSESNRSLKSKFLILTFLLPAGLLASYAPLCLLVVQILLVCAVQLLFARVSGCWFTRANATSLVHLESQSAESG
jgi:low temperature requirement protein LtrA